MTTFKRGQPTPLNMHGTAPHGSASFQKLYRTPPQHYACPTPLLWGRIRYSPLSVLILMTSHKASYSGIISIVPSHVSTN
jgi:hypothetical protein